MPDRWSLRLLPFFPASLALLGACAEPSRPAVPPQPDAEQTEKQTEKQPSSSAHELCVGGCWEPGRNRLTLPGPVVFEPGKAVLTAGNDEVLAVVREYLEANPEITVLRIEGHTDDFGLPIDAKALSAARAMAVARWLVDEGIPCKRLIAVGFGLDKPLADGTTPEGREANRRITVVPAELRGKPIGGMPLDGGGLVAGDPCQKAPAGGAGS